MSPRTAYEVKAKATHVWMVALLLLSSGCVLQPIRVSGNAMAPTLKDGERALVTRIFERIERGDIVGFKYPRNESKSFVERIVGLPGEQIAMTKGAVVINGRPFDESYLSDTYRSSDTWGPTTIPDGEYFMLGDNRRNSSDSRTWGTVRREHIWAKVINR